MHGKGVGSIIGKKGESVKRFREESGARINISEGNCPERIITVTGPTNAIFKAFAMIIDKLEEDINSSMTNSTAASRPPVTLRLVVPATQCNSLIGKGGCKIKDPREYGGAGPGGGGYAAQLHRAGHHHRWRAAVCYRVCQADLPGHAGDALPVSARESHDRSVPAQAGQLPSHLRGRPRSLNQVARQQSHFAMMHGGTGFAGIDSSSPEVKGYWASLDASTQTTHELTIPNNLIGCIIGRQGAYINEIRQMPGAQIKIANPVEGSSGRQVTITGSAASISLAQYLINARLSSEKGMGCS
ncbi:Poly(rC)-binding protein 1 [Saguinus oedipus]|uniref:Poly(RC)-binding protein 1 n=1 Tax=Saguinus oedipus TaxID=9490 RepID=A0ABQ9VMY1_SAGOE|nr:Poly(rC)-binding protein 1 [Saguinus oedipus]